MRLTSTNGWWGNEASPDLPSGVEPVGYAWMVRHRNLDVMPHHRWSFAGRVGGRQSHDFDGLAWEAFPASYAPAGAVGHVEFALKYDGVNLEILRAWFETLSLDEIEAFEGWVRASPTSTYARRAWFLYELLTGRELTLDDVGAGPYTPVLDPERYLVGDERRVRRQRVVDNLLGNREICPLVRRTPALEDLARRKLHDRISKLLGEQDADILSRMVSYLYTKETRSSFEIEKERPTSERVARFVAVLHQAHDLPVLTREHLVKLQNTIVTDPRCRDNEYRRNQNYVGCTVPQRPDFVSPRPDDLASMMDGWMRALQRLVASKVDAVVAAAAAAFLFVYLHPFEDGNGRIHRFLIHYVLAQKGFTPPGALVPVSATMLARRQEYDAALERFSKPLMARLRYEMDSEERVEVLHDTALYYRYPDLTTQAEALYGWVAETIEHEVPREIAFLLAYREARRRLAEIVELPDRLANHFVARCIEGRGRLSKTRRRRDFEAYSDEEIAAMEGAVRGAMAESGLELQP